MAWGSELINEELTLIFRTNILLRAFWRRENEAPTWRALPAFAFSIQMLICHNAASGGWLVKAH
jgi:hypothetical protein